MLINMLFPLDCPLTQAFCGMVPLMPHPFELLVAWY